MLSVKLSKLLAEKNVPHEGGWYWYKKFMHKDDLVLEDFNFTRSGYLTEMAKSLLKEGYAVPAYPEIALFKYAKVIWDSRASHAYKGNNLRCECGHPCTDLTRNCPLGKPTWKYKIEKLADLFSSGASLEKIEEYVLSSIEEA